MFYLLQEFDPVHSRHFNIGQDNRRAFFAEDVEGFRTIFGGKYGITGVG